MKKRFQKIIYSLGINISGYNVDEEIRLLKAQLPSKFTKRRVVDVGCGDGKTSLKLRKILKPVFYQGVDLSPALISRAQKRGLNAQVKDVSKEEIYGDLGILWGVIHHFNEPVETLQKIYTHFNSLIIRAPVEENRFCELGHKFNKREFLEILSEAGINSQDQIIVKAPKNNSLILFIDR